MGTALLLLTGAVLLALAVSHRWRRRLPLTAAVVYLVAGWLAGLVVGALPMEDWKAALPALHLATEFALLMSLFGIGLRLRRRLDRGSWRAAALMAGPGMVLAILAGALAAVQWLGLPWPAALLLAAILAPTDPVLASEVQVRSETDGDAVRRVLTAEGALNDATAFPAVMLALGVLGLHALGVGGPTGSLRWWWEDLLWPMAGGGLLGLGLGRLLGAWLRWCVGRGELLARDELLFVGTVALASGLARVTQTSAFLLVFCTGLVLLPRSSRASAAEGDLASLSLPDRIDGFGSRVERLVEAASVLALGLALHSVRVEGVTLGFALSLLLLVRPLSVRLVLPGSGLLRGQRRLLAWFGIRGLGSLFYLCHALQAGLAGAVAEAVASATLVSIALSLLLHGVSVTPLMTAYRHRRAGRPRGPGEDSARAAAPEQVDDGQQDHRAEQGDQQRAHAEDALVDRGNAQDGRDEDAGDRGPDDAHDHVQQDALLSVRAHQEAGDPADQATHDEQHDEIDHEETSYTARRGQAGSFGNRCAIEGAAMRPDGWGA